MIVPGSVALTLVCRRDEATAIATRILEAGISAIGMEALNMARVEAFMPWFHQDVQAGGQPLIFGHAGRISNTKGCFIGQETVAKTRDRGHPPRQMILLKSSGKKVPDSGTELVFGDYVVGTITSATYSPRFQALLAMAVVKYRFIQDIGKQDNPTVHDLLGNTWTVDQISDYKG